MKMGMLKKISVCAGAVGCVSLLISENIHAISFGSEESLAHYYLEDEYHADLDYGDMVIRWVDEDATLAFLDSYEETIASGSADEIKAGYDKIVALLDYADTQYELNEIRYNCNVNNDEYAELSRHMSEFNTDLQDRCYGLLRDALTSEHGDVLRSYMDNDDLADDLLDYEDMTEEQRTLNLEYDELTQEYDRLYLADVHVEIDGEDWNFDRLSSDTSLDYDEYYDIATALYREQNASLAPIYVKIVDNLNKRAATEGYDNFADYAYENIYARDYTTDDIREVYKEVQDYIVPLHEELEDRAGYNFKLEYMDLTGEKRIERVAPIISKIHPDLQEAWDYLIEHHLYDIDASESKMETGYTVPLFIYGAPFIFDSPYGNWRDIETVIHEFGHYNETYHSQGHVITYIHNVDVMEIHSQGLELLCLEYADEIYGASNAEDARFNVLRDMTTSVIDGCVYDEFQYMAYTYDGELTVDKLNEMYSEVCSKYGQDYPVGSAESYFWVEIPHTFESPMYYISYATSALAALDIFAMSTENREAAIDCYMHLTTYSGETGFREVLDDVGLPDIFEKGTIEDISIAVADYVGVDSPAGIVTGLLHDPVFIISASIVIIALIAAIAIRLRTRARMKTYPSIY